LIDKEYGSHNWKTTGQTKTTMLVSTKIMKTSLKCWLNCLWTTTWVRSLTSNSYVKIIKLKCRIWTWTRVMRCTNRQLCWVLRMTASLSVLSKWHHAKYVWAIAHILVIIKMLVYHLIHHDRKWINLWYDKNVYLIKEINKISMKLIKYEIL